MVILIVNREHRIEFKYNSDCEKFIEELHSSLSDVHFQVVHKSETYVYVVNHDALIKKLLPQITHFEPHPSGNPF